MMTRKPTPSRGSKDLFGIVTVTPPGILDEPAVEVAFVVVFSVAYTRA
jgi:hypothetical protein